MLCIVIPTKAMRETGDVVMIPKKPVNVRDSFEPLTTTTVRSDEAFHKLFVCDCSELAK